ncbi:MAG: helix-turn-helix transcriptional regulator [Chitinophagaceae bacterium]|nr:helix-turn-helix transcriptional regulator [Chitinophagaceae bacterium]
MIASLYDVMHSSKGSWQGVGFSIEKLIASGGHRETYSGHRIGVNLGPSHYAHAKRRGRWGRFLYQTGAFGLIPHGDANEFRAFENVVYAAACLKPVFLEELFDKGKIRLREDRGVVDPTIYSLVLKLRDELMDPHFVGKIYAESLIQALSLHLVSIYPDGNNKILNPKGRLTSAQLKTTIEYCYSMVGNNPGIYDLAAQANLSPFHFTRLFKQTTGFSPYQYLLQLRVEAAKKLIRTGRYPLTEIAYELGYSDQAHFCKAFRRVTGMSPGHF